jgi:amidase
VGIKPTVGLVSRAGIIPIAHSQDTAGPMTRTVADAAALLSAIAGVDARDPATRDAAPHVAPDYTKFLDPNGLRGKRIGIPRDHYYGYSDVTDGIAQSAIDVMKAQGAVIVDPADIPTAATLGKSEFDVLLYEFKADLDAYLADLGPKAPVHTLAELIAWNDAHRAEELPWFNQDILIMAQKKGPLSDEKYKKALADSKRLAGREGIDAVMEKHRLDALVAPTSSPPWLIDLVNGDADNGGGCSSPAAIAGYPHITVPAGYAFGLPVGISFFGRAWSEPVLIAMAYAYEQASKMRRPPGFARTAELRAG